MPFTSKHVNWLLKSCGFKRLACDWQFTKKGKADLTAGAHLAPFVAGNVYSMKVSSSQTSSGKNNKFIPKLTSWYFY